MPWQQERQTATALNICMSVNTNTCRLVHLDSREKDGDPAQRLVGPIFLRINFMTFWTGLGDVQADVLPPVSLLLATLLWRQRWVEVMCR